MCIRDSRGTTRSRSWRSYPPLTCGYGTQARRPSTGGAGTCWPATSPTASTSGPGTLSPTSPTPCRPVPPTSPSRRPATRTCSTSSAGPTSAAKRDPEQGLIDHLERFLLELGQGFAFVGRQVHLEKLATTTSTPTCSPTTCGSGRLSALGSGWPSRPAVSGWAYLEFVRACHVPVELRHGEGGHAVTWCVEQALIDEPGPGRTHLFAAAAHQARDVSCLLRFRSELCHGPQVLELKVRRALSAYPEEAGVELRLDQHLALGHQP